MGHNFRPRSFHEALLALNPSINSNYELRLYTRKSIEERFPRKRI